MNDKLSLIEEAVLVLFMLEREFPPTFMDIMSHLLIHLVEELFICRPVYSRWMYPMERYMKSFKDFVRIYSKPEGNMAEGYAMEDTLGFCTEYSVTRGEQKTMGARLCNREQCAFGWSQNMHSTLVICTHV